MTCKECNGSKIIQSKAGKVAGHICFHCGGSGEEPISSPQEDHVCSCHQWNDPKGKKQGCMETCGRCPPQEDWEKQIEEIIYDEIDHNMGSNGHAIERLKQLFISHEQKIRADERKKVEAEIEESYRKMGQ